MKLKIECKKLVKLLSNLAPISTRTTSLPILGNALLEGKKCDFSREQVLEASATNLTVSWTERIKHEVEGEVLIPIKTVLGLLKKLPGDCYITLTSDEGTVTILYPGGTYTAFVSSPSDYPAIPVATSTKVAIDTKALIGLLSRVRNSTARNDIRYYLNGVLLEGKDRTLTAVGTNGHRMSVAWIPSDILCRVIIPNEAVDQILRLSGDALICIDNNALSVKTENSDLSTKLIDGKFPDWTFAVPKDSDKTLNVNSLHLLDKLKRLMAVSSENRYGFILAILSMSSGNIVLKTKEDSQLKEFSETIDGTYDGEELTIGFNAKYLMSALESRSFGPVSIQFSNPDRPALINDESGLDVIGPARM